MRPPTTGVPPIHAWEAQTILTNIPDITTDRISLQPFDSSDAPALAAILADPEVTRTITANCSSPERCLASAEKRIGWHNGTWEQYGYGVWAVWAEEDAIAPQGTLIGWCGFSEPVIGEDPEILYGLRSSVWGRGIAQEAARTALDWLWSSTSSTGVSAIIFARLNPASVAIVHKLGMTLCGTMEMGDFLPDHDFARDVLDYEIWRLADGVCLDAEALLFQAPYRGGQIASLEIADSARVEQAFCDAALRRTDYATLDSSVLQSRVRKAFRQGMAEPDLDWYHLARAQ